MASFLNYFNNAKLPRQELPQIALIPLLRKEYFLSWISENWSCLIPFASLEFHPLLVNFTI